MMVLVQSSDLSVSLVGSQLKRGVGARPLIGITRLAPRRPPRAECLRTPRPFNSPSISAPDSKPDLLTPNAALVEANTLERVLTRAEQISLLEDLVAGLKLAPSYADKLNIVLSAPVTKRFLATPAGRILTPHLASLPPIHAFSIACLPTISQEHVLRVLPPNGALFPALAALAATLSHVEEFYDSIGGLAGYQLQCLRAIDEHHCGGATSSVEDAGPGSADVDFLVPRGLDLSRSPAAGAAATAAGLAGMPHMAEIYPLGGAGDRLGLRCEHTGDSLPTAVLPYCGRSLLEALVRDLQAREYLYYKVYGSRLTTPMAVMTSAVKDNHARVSHLFEEAGWFGRGRDAFRLFQQPLVPVVAAQDARWLLSSPLQPVMKPGGHGVIWKLMLDCGVFGWLERAGRSAAVVRQISNPMAGQDSTLLALAGQGLGGGHAFGFASCERVVGAAEGMNVLRMLHSVDPSTGQPRRAFGITNVEYTEFERLGIEDKGCPESGAGHSVFPANTNVLFLGLSKVEEKVRESVAAGTTHAVLPGMILNLKKEASHVDLGTGEHRKTRAGRLECTMQNLADCFVTEVASTSGGGGGAQAAAVPEPPALDTFMVYGPRRKVTSSAKRQRSPGSLKVHQTPDGSFYDLMQNAALMLAQAGWEVPSVGAVQPYLDSGPGFVFLFHPALGPLWAVVAQKLRGGRLAERSEVQLEVAEADIEGLDVDGSLLVVADCPLGHLEAPATSTSDSGGRGSSEGDGGSVAEQRLVYSERCGRVRLHNVTVRNAGIDWADPGNVYWQHRVARKAACRVVLRGVSEFEAVGVELTGDLAFEVPDGQRMRVFRGESGEMVVETSPLLVGVEDGGGSGAPVPTWRWEYCMGEDDKVVLTMN